MFKIRFSAAEAAFKKQFSDGLLETARFREASLPCYERIGAPRVGHDSAANQWILQARGAKTSEEVAAVLKEFDGYYVVHLVECDGVRKYSNGGLYDGADQTSFRGAFLNDCHDVLGTDLLNDAWNHKFPEQAVAYGRALLAAAKTADGGDGAPRRRRSIFARLGLAKEREQLLIPEQIEIVRAAGR